MSYLCESSLLVWLLFQSCMDMILFIDYESFRCEMKKGVNVILCNIVVLNSYAKCQEFLQSKILIGECFSMLDSLM